MTLYSPLHCRDDEDDEDLIDLTSNHRYIQARVPIRKDGNPRGKYPRKPLPWGVAKLSRVAGWEEDADLYREHLWREQQKQTKRPHKTRNQPTQNTDEPQLSTPSKQKKKRIENPHYLTALDAMSKHKGRLRYYVGCSCCDDYARTQKMRDYKMECQRRCIDGQREFEIEYMIYDDVENDFEDWRLEAWPPLPVAPGAQVIIDQIVRSREEPVYRIRYRTSKRRRTAARRPDEGCVSALIRENVSKQVGDDGYLHHDNGAEYEWDFLDGGSDNGSIWTDVGPFAFEDEERDDANSSDEEGDWILARLVSG